VIPRSDRRFWRRALHRAGFILDRPASAGDRSARLPPACTNAHSFLVVLKGASVLGPTSPFPVRRNLSSVTPA
jgi:hypothetical protein